MSERISDPELSAALEPAGVACNRFYLVPGGPSGGARLAFGVKGPDGVVRYHLAIQMSVEGISALRDFLVSNVRADQKPIGGGSLH